MLKFFDVRVLAKLRLQGFQLTFNRCVNLFVAYIEYKPPNKIRIHFLTSRPW